MVRASSVFPDPGGPMSRIPWPPASAISSARRASSWPRTSARSGQGSADEASADSARDPSSRPAASTRSGAGFGRRRERLERTTSTAAESEPTGTTSIPSTRRASSTTAAGTTTRRTPRRCSAATIGSIPGTAAHLAAQPELTDERQASGRRQHLLRPEEDRHRDRQVERRARLAQVRRREVDRDPARRVDEPGVAQRAADPLARLLERCVGQSDDREPGQPGRDVDLDPDRPGRRARGASRRGRSPARDDLSGRAITCDSPGASPGLTRGQRAT